MRSNVYWRCQSIHFLLKPFTIRNLPKWGTPITHDLLCLSRQWYLLLTAILPRSSPPLFSSHHNLNCKACNRRTDFIVQQIYSLYSRFILLFSLAWEDSRDVQTHQAEVRLRLREAHISEHNLSTWQLGRCTTLQAYDDRRQTLRWKMYELQGKGHCERIHGNGELIAGGQGRRRGLELMRRE